MSTKCGSSRILNINFVQAYYARVNVIDATKKLLYLLVITFHIWHYDCGTTPFRWMAHPLEKSSCSAEAENRFTETLKPDMLGVHRTGIKVTFINKLQIGVLAPA
jgi:hypothetical protein